MNIKRVMNGRRPWTIEVPVKKGRFSALNSKHAKLNVVVDLEAIGAYGFAKKRRDDRELLHSDFQCDPAVPTFPRLGAGRAGIFKGHYLKGVGRTQLAGNWNRQQDVLHGTGHLRTCAALREFIVTEYLAARGASDLIVGCEGLLIAPIDKKLNGILEHVVRSKAGLLKPIDLRFQAISVKKANFARYSNFSWLVDNLFSREDNMQNFFWCLENFMFDQNGDTDRCETGHQLAARIEEMTELLVTRFLRTIKAGINWNAYHNNFSVDGRFIDIEGPLILGRPFVGSLFDRTFKEDFSWPAVGFELVHVLWQIHGHLRHLVARIELALELNKNVRGPVSEYAKSFARDIDDYTQNKSSVFSRRVIVERIVKQASEFGIGSSGLRAVRDYAAGVHDFYFRGKDIVPRLSVLSATSMNLRVASPNSVQNLVLQPVVGSEVNRDDYRDTEFISEMLQELENQKDLDTLLSKIASIPTKMRREIRTKKR